MFIGKGLNKAELREEFESCIVGTEGYKELRAALEEMEHPERVAQWSASLRALPELEARQSRGRASERYGAALTDALLMASRDGVSFKRWNEAFLRPGIERPGTWHYGHQYMAWHVVETESAIPGAPRELSFYAVESYWTRPGSALRGYTCLLYTSPSPRDRG